VRPTGETAFGYRDNQMLQQAAASQQDFSTPPLESNQFLAGVKYGMALATAMTQETTRPERAEKDVD